MEHITLFTDIMPEEQERIRVCFKVREEIFQNGETIMEYSSSMKKIGLSCTAAMRMEMSM